MKTSVYEHGRCIRIVNDGRVLRGLANKCGFKYDKTYKYITHISWEAERKLKALGYSLKYFDGCFCPYVIQL